jgi:enoyl-CoA hydratase
LTVDPSGLVDLEINDDIATISLHRPPVNALSVQLRLALLNAIGRAENDHAVGAIILTGCGSGFSAGGDREEIATGAVTSWPRLTLDIHPKLEQMQKPIVAAAHGYAVGGGFETLLACHFRVACADTKLGLPEISAGIVPLSGTQRLPRVLSMVASIDMLLTARKRPARDFSHTGLFDRLVADGDVESLRHAAMEIAHSALAAGPPYPLVRHRKFRDVAAAISLIELTRDQLACTTDVVLREAILDALKAAVTSESFDAGMRIAARICENVLTTRREM